MNPTWQTYVLRIILVTFVAIGWQASQRSAQAEQLRAKDLFDASRLMEVEIEIPEQDWAALCQQSRGQNPFDAIFATTNESPFTYFKGNVKINGVVIPNVGIRKKGFIGSLDDTRPSLKIKFSEYVEQTPVSGLDRLTLNNNKQDPSLLSQYLSYRVFQAAGIHAPRCSLARVTVNGNDLGVYSHVESVKKPFLTERFGDASGNLYEGTLADFYPKSLGRLESKFGAKAVDDADVVRLAELLASNDALPMDEINRLLDVDNFLKFWAVESLLGFWDGYTQNQNNFFVYDNPANGKFYFMPWGADSCFTEGGGPFRFGNRKAESVNAESMLPNRLYHVDEIANRYKEAMLEVLDQAWKEDEMLAEIDRMEKLTEDQRHPQQASRRGGPGWGIPVLTTDDLRQFIRGRRKQILAELEQWPVPVPDRPRKPMYAVKVGAASGEISAVWMERTSQDTKAATTPFQLEFKGEEDATTDLTIIARPMRAFGFGGREGRAEDLPATIEIRGNRVGKEGPLALTIMVPQEALKELGDQPIAVSGTFSSGNRGFFQFGPPSQMLNGTLHLTETGTEAGSAIRGKLQVTIVEMRGGMMDMMRGQRPE